MRASRKIRIIKFHPATATRQAYCDKPIEREVAGKSIEEIRTNVRKVLRAMNLQIRSMNMAVDGSVQIIVWHKKPKMDAKVLSGWRWSRPAKQPGV